MFPTKSFEHLGLGNPFVSDSKVEATTRLIDAILDGEPVGIEWVKRLWVLAPRLAGGNQRQVLCHCGGHKGCHGHLVAALLNAKYDKLVWFNVLRQHKDRIGGAPALTF